MEERDWFLFLAASLCGRLYSSVSYSYYLWVSMEIKTARRGPQGKESSVFDRLGALSRTRKAFKQQQQQDMQILAQW